MPQPRFRSRSLRRVKVTTPGGVTKTVYKRRKPSKPKCGECKRPLTGTARELPSKMRNISKSSKRPERPYGGVLCSSCSRKKQKEKARELGA
ncbi:MAG: 50S ribosomal protein L34e [Nanoarchaeota archaeon]